MPVRPIIPPAAVWLGSAGLLPFLAAAAVLVLQRPAPPAALQALLAYGAAILSFLGGIHWGLAVAMARPQRLWSRLGLSVVPALLAWVALLLPDAAGLLLLSAGLALTLVADLRATSAGLAPNWYPRLRLPLSLGAMVALLVGAWVAV